MDKCNKAPNRLKKYQSIDEFQEDYPEKEDREAFVHTLTNEEIDELIDLCNTIQGKIYYQKMKKTELVFGYTLSDAWLVQLSAVKVKDGPDGAYVEYFNNADGGFASGTLSEECWEKVKLPRDDIKRIRTILDDDHLFETEALEESVQWIVLDGYKQEFEINSKNRYIKATGKNIQSCKDDLENCLHSVLMAKTLEKIRKVLVPVGIPGNCLKLTRS